MSAQRHLRPPFPKGKSGNPGGRPVGAVSKASRLSLKEREALLIDNEWLTPLRFLMSVMVCNDNALDVRMEAAKACLPYIHRKMPVHVEFSDPSELAKSLPPLQINFIDKLEGNEVPETQTVCHETLRRRRVRSAKAKQAADHE